MQNDAHPLGLVAEDEVGQGREQQRIAQNHPALKGRQGTHLGQRQADHNRRNRHAHPGPRTGRPHIEQRPPIKRGGLHPNKGAKGADRKQIRRRRQKIRQARPHAVETGKAVMAHLMAQQDGHQGQGKRQSQDKRARVNERVHTALKGAGKGRGGQGCDKQQEGQDRQPSLGSGLGWKRQRFRERRLRAPVSRKR